MPSLGFVHGMIQSPWLIYGANGYTGELIARAAVERGMRPILAGRSRERVEPLARELGLDWRVFALDGLSRRSRAPSPSPSPEDGGEGLNGIELVLHCAGPFSQTSLPMVERCLAARTHYLDITGEISVIERTLAKPQAAKAREAGIVLCSGVGFDVVPTDCVALKLKQLLPDATHLSLGLDTTDFTTSPGTLKTVIESLRSGTLRRRNGCIEKTPTSELLRAIDFGHGETTAMAVSWGDVASAYYSTGIPNIDTWMAVPGGRTGAFMVMSTLRPVLATGVVQSLLKKLVDSLVKGPTADERSKSRTWVWGEATNAAGEKKTVRIEMGNVYDGTVEAALMVVTHLLETPCEGGSYTPAMLLGSGSLERLGFTCQS